MRETTFIKTKYNKHMKNTDNVLIVGGTFANVPKASSVIKKLAANIRSKFERVTVINGGTIDEIQNISVRGYRLIIWMPNLSNEIEKVYPQKDIGAVLICSKVIHDNLTIGDAVSRIFVMQANAVIAITSENKTFHFNMVDALGNTWVKTSDLIQLTEDIKNFYEWSSNSTRIPSIRDIRLPLHTVTPELTELCNVVKSIADKVESERGGRYFGNVSTRCEKLFPSMIDKECAIVSARNIKKNRLTEDDFVTVKLISETVFFNSSILAKPSVDSAIQLRIYREFPELKYMIHGHAYIENAPFTDMYYPCGDLREAYEIWKLFKNNHFVINLKHHGFIIAANNMGQLIDITKNLQFRFREIGVEFIE